MASKATSARDKIWGAAEGMVSLAVRLALCAGSTPVTDAVPGARPPSSTATSNSRPANHVRGRCGWVPEYADSLDKVGWTLAAARAGGRTHA